MQSYITYVSINLQSINIVYKMTFIFSLNC